MTSSLAVGLFQLVTWRSAQMTLLAGLVIIGLSVVGRWLTPGWRHALWTLVLARGVLLLSPQAPWSIYDPFTNVKSWLVGVGAQAESASETEPRIVRLNVGVATPAPQADDPMVSQTLPAPAPWDLVDYLTAIWTIGAGGLLTLALTRQISFVRALRRDEQPAPNDLVQALESARRELGLRRRVELRLTTLVDSPAVLGLLRPKVLLPMDHAETVSLGQTRLVFLHELAHVRRGDLWVQVGVELACALHWFNPLAWLARARIDRYREEACDRIALDVVGFDLRKEYGKMIVQMMERLSSHPNGGAVASLGLVRLTKKLRASQARLRIESILTSPKPSSWIATGLACLAVFACGVGLLDASPPESQPEPKAPLVIKVPPPEAKTLPPVAATKATPRPNPEPATEDADAISLRVYPVGDIEAELFKGFASKDPTENDILKGLGVQRNSMSKEFRGAWSKSDKSFVVSATRRDHDRVATAIADIRHEIQPQYVIETRILEIDAAHWPRFAKTLTADSKNAAARLVSVDVCRKMLETAQGSRGVVTICAPKITVLGGQNAVVQMGGKVGHVLGKEDHKLSEDNFIGTEITVAVLRDVNTKARLRASLAHSILAPLEQRNDPAPNKQAKGNEPFTVDTKTLATTADLGPDDALVFTDMRGPDKSTRISLINVRKIDRETISSGKPLRSPFVNDETTATDVKTKAKTGETKATN